MNARSWDKREQEVHQEVLRKRLDEAQARRSKAREAGDKGALILAAYDCGQVHFELGDMDLGYARKRFGEAIKLIEESGLHPELLPELFGMTGRTHQQMKRWQDVLPWYRRAAEAASAQHLPTQQLRWLGKEASTCLAMNDRDRGRTLLTQAIETGRALLAAGQPVAEPLVDLFQQRASLEITTTEEADMLWKEVDSLLTSLPPSQAHVLAAVNHAALYTARNQPWIAQTYLEEALELDAKIGADELSQRQIELQRAALLNEQNEPVQAGKGLMAYLPRCVDDRGRHDVLTAAVNAFFEGRAWELMRVACEKLRELRRYMAPGWRYELEMLSSVASHELGAFDEALRELDAALEFARICGNPEAITKARGQTAIVCLDMGDVAGAARLGEELHAQGVRHILATRTLVRALIGKGDLDRAEGIIAEFEAAGEGELGAAHLRAYLADAGRGDPAVAWRKVSVKAAGRDHSIQAEALGRIMALAAPGSRERLAHAAHRLRLMDAARMRVNDVFSDASWLAATKEACQFPGWLDDFIGEAISGVDDEAAIYELERFRAQTLVNLLAEREARWTGEVHRGWYKGKATTQLQRARYRFEALAARGSGWRERREAALEVQRLATMALSAEGLIHFAPANQGMYFPHDLSDLLGDHHLAEGECLLFAHPLPDRLAVWARDPAGTMRRTTLPGFGRAVVERMTQTLRAIGSRGEQPNVDELLVELDLRFGKPLAAWLAEAGVRRAFLAAGTALTALPLDCCAALLTPEASELVLLPSGAAFGFTRGVRKPLPEDIFLVEQADLERLANERMEAVRGCVLVVVDPSRDLDFAPLEAALVATIYCASKLEILDQDELDPKSIAAACGRTDVLHFTGHGDFDDANPYRSGLLIGPLDKGSLWSNADIFSDVDAPAARLAVLSGCETGQTRPNLISEEVSLPAAFIAAGYVAVVASRWAINDLSATVLMNDFHRRWTTGTMSVAAALAASRCWLRDLGQEEAHDVIIGLADTAAAALPSRAEEFRALCEHALQLIASEGEHPFANPLYWAPFFVTGDGAITYNGSWAE